MRKRTLWWWPRYLVATAALLGLFVVAVALRTRGEALALRGARAAAHVDLERREVLVPPSTTRDDDHWRAHLGVVAHELQRGHVDAAVRAWHDAYGAAVASRGWEGLLAVGDAFLAIGRAARATGGARINAREAYLSALIRARRDRSVDGVLRVADAFGELGERVLVEQCFHIAERLADGDEQAARRVREARERWAPWNMATGF